MGHVGLLWTGMSIYGNEEWCALSTYTIGLTFTIVSQEAAHFLFIQ